MIKNKYWAKQTLEIFGLGYSTDFGTTTEDKTQNLVFQTPNRPSIKFTMQWL